MDDEEAKFNYRAEGGGLFSVNSDGYVVLSSDELDYEDTAFDDNKEVRFLVSNSHQ